MYIYQGEQHKYIHTILKPLYEIVYTQVKE